MSIKSQNPSVSLELVADGLTSPVALVPSPDTSGNLFVADQTGKIYILKPDSKREVFLDITARMVPLDRGYDERGLLGLAFHPKHQDNGRLFVYYSAPLRPGAPAGWDHTSRVSEFRVSAADSDWADPDSEEVILEVDEPQMNHNGGQIAFGPDGFLYIPLGDGGGANDVGIGHPPGGNGQDISTLLGKILRIDIDHGTPYAIPIDNPFANSGGRPEIFAWGLRNPFRIAFDMGGRHELFAGDVGQHQWEEIDIVVKSGNYGWNLMEGTHGFDPGDAWRLVDAPTPEVNAQGQPLISPIIEYKNASVGGIGSAVIGGYIYRGKAMPDFDGAYIFGDFSDNTASASGTLFIARRTSKPDAKWPFEELTVSGSATGKMNTLLRSFGQDAAGEIYALTADHFGPMGTTGKVWKVAPGG